MRALAVFFGVVALLWFILPFLQILTGVYEGGEAFVGCWFFSALFHCGCYRAVHLLSCRSPYQEEMNGSSSGPTSYGVPRAKR